MRRLIRDHGPTAALIVVAAMLLRLLVPTGFMPVSDAEGRLTVMVCSGGGSRAMTVVIPGLEKRGDPAVPAGRDTAGTVCAAAGLSAPWLGGTDPILSAAPRTDVAALAIRAPHPLRPLALPRLRPLPRAPPRRSIA